MDISTPFTTRERVILVLLYGLPTLQVVVTALQRHLASIIVVVFFVLMMWFRERKPNPRWSRWMMPPAIVIVTVGMVQGIVRFVQ